MPKDMTAPQDIYERRESEARSYCRSMPAIFHSASGSQLTTTEGQEFIDFLAGCSSLNYGHNDPDMKDALIQHISSDGLAHGLDLHSDAKGQFLSAFEQHILVPRNMDHRVMFTGPTGANAVEAAIKIARKVTGRSNIIAFTNGFHGVTLGALAATGNSYHRGGSGVSLGDVTRMPYDGYFGEDVDTANYLETMLKDASGGIDAPAAIILETVQGEGGLNAASADWIKRIARLARDNGALLIVDDIQAGCGRCGTFFSFEDMDIVPDIVTMAKSLSGFGLPMAMLLVRPEYDVFGPAEHNGTFRGNTHAFVTARVTIEKFWADDSFQNTLKERSNLIHGELTKLAKIVGNGRMKGRGLMQGVDVGSGKLASDICSRAYENGLIIETSGNEDQVVKVLAPLTTPTDILNRGFNILHTAAKNAVSEHVSINMEQSS